MLVFLKTAKNNGDTIQHCQTSVVQIVLFANSTELNVHSKLKSNMTWQSCCVNLIKWCENCKNW